MNFTKEKCKEEIFLDTDHYPLRYTGNTFMKFPTVLEIVRLKLKDTSFLVEMADAIREEKNGSYDFYIEIDDYWKISSRIECEPWIIDEETGDLIETDMFSYFVIPLDEYDKANIYERLNELCLEQYGMSCEEMVESWPGI